MRTTATLALAATSVLAGLTTTLTSATAAEEPTVVHERGIVLECTGHGDGIDAYVNLYENPELNYAQVVLNDDPALAASREPADIWDDGEVRAAVRIDGKRARIVGTASVVGKKKAVHDEVDDAGQHIVMDGYHRRLRNDLELRFSGAVVPLDCAPAFFYRLTTTRTDVTG